MAMADDRQRQLPLVDDRSPERSQTLAYPEAVLLTNPIEPEFKGEVLVHTHLHLPINYDHVSVYSSRINDGTVHANGLNR